MALFFDPKPRQLQSAATVSGAPLQPTTIPTGYLQTDPPLPAQPLATYSVATFLVEQGIGDSLAVQDARGHGLLSLNPRPSRQMNDDTELQAAAFRRLLQHLDARKDVQNIDLMINAGFCRNCLADWYRDAAAAQGQTLSKEQARERIYGMPFAEWKAQFQQDATPEQLAAFDAAQRRHG